MQRGWKRIIGTVKRVYKQKNRMGTEYLDVADIVFDGRCEGVHVAFPENSAPTVGSKVYLRTDGWTARYIRIKKLK